MNRHTARANPLKCILKLNTIKFDKNGDLMKSVIKVLTSIL
jgi:hypothetical protein